MDRNSATGLILIILLTMAYFMWFAPKPPSQQQAQNNNPTSQTEEQLDQREESTPEEVNLSEVEKDSLATARLKDEYSDFYTLVQGEESVVKVETDLLTVEINTKGGNIAKAALNNYVTFDSTENVALISINALLQPYDTATINQLTINHDKLTMQCLND